MDGHVLRSMVRPLQELEARVGRFGHQCERQGKDWSRGLYCAEGNLPGEHYSSRAQAMTVS